MVAVRVDGHTVVYPLARIADRADKQGRLTVNQDGVEIAFEYYPGPQAVRVMPGASDKPVEVFHSAWFAWHAFYPGDPIYPTR